MKNIIGVSGKDFDRFFENILFEAWRQKRIAYTGTTSFTVPCRYCIFHKLKVCDNPTSSKSVGTIFPTIFAHFTSLCHILVILTIFQSFSLLHLLLWSVISDRGGFIVTVLGPWELCPRKVRNLVHVCALAALLLDLSPDFLPLLWNDTEIRLINNPRRASECKVEPRVSHFKWEARND